MKKTALIVGASRGLGLGLVEEFGGRGWRVIATERKQDPESGLRRYAKRAQDLRIEQLEVNDQAQLARLVQALEGEKLDLLFVNAGIAGEKGSINQMSDADFNRVMGTNALAPLRIIEALAPQVVPGGTIAAMSSLMGSIADNTSGGMDLYRASKSALNMLLKCFEARDQGRHTILAMHPGWVRTDMGGPQATLDVSTSVRGLVEAIEARAGLPGLKFVDFRNKELPW